MPEVVKKNVKPTITALIAFLLGAGSGTITDRTIEANRVSTRMAAATHYVVDDSYVDGKVLKDTTINEKDTAIQVDGKVYIRSEIKYNPLIYLKNPGIIVTAEDTVNDTILCVMRIGADTTALFSLKAILKP